MLIDFIIDGLLAVLLVVVIVSSYLLNSRIVDLRKGQSELASLVQRLDLATKQALSGVELLKKTSHDTTSDIDREFGRARALADELSVITEAGENLASRLEKGLTNLKGRENPPSLSEIEKEMGSEITEEEEAVLQALKEAR